MHQVDALALFYILLGAVLVSASIFLEKLRRVKVATKSIGFVVVVSWGLGAGAIAALQDGTRVLGLVIVVLAANGIWDVFKGAHRDWKYSVHDAQYQRRMALQRKQRELELMQ